MKFRRYVGVVSLIVLIGAIWTVGAAAAEETDKTAYSVLCDLGIYTEESGAYNADRSVTRGEFADIAVRLTGADVSHMTDRGFGDVPASHKYFDGIYQAISAGLLKGDYDGNFRPNENMKYEEMTAVVIRILGYEQMTEHSGAYPNSYINKAGEIGLLKGVDGSVGKDMTFSGMTSMLYNALNTDCCTVTISGAYPKYSVENGNTLLRQNFNIIKARGIVTGNNITKLTKPSAMPDNTIEIDGNEFICEINEAQNMLGFPVEYYYEDSKDGMILKHIHSRLKNELVIDADRIDALEGETYKYYSSESSSSIRNASFSKQADIIYNGKAASDVDGILIPQSGQVRMIDNDFDGKYDVVFIDEYVNIVAGSISWSNYTVYDKYAPSKKIKLRDSDEYDVITVKDVSGMEIPFDELREWDVLSVAATKDGGGYAKVIVNYNELSGIVTSIGSDLKDRTAYTIDGEMYSVSADIADAAKPKDVINKHITAGLDCFGKIAYIKSDSAVKEDMGYLMDAKSYKDESGEDMLLVKIFSMSGEELSLNGADKINIDGNKVNKEDAIKYLVDENGVKNGVVTYQINSDSRLKMLDTAYGYNEAPGSGEVENSIHILYPKTNLRYKKNMKSFGGKLCVSADTLFLYVPQDKTAARQYKILDAGYFVNDDNYDIEAYAVDSESLSAEVLVVHGSGAEAIDGSSAPILVQKKYVTINEDGDTVHFLCGYSLDKDKGYQEIYAIDDKLLSDVFPGDVIRCGLDSMGNIEKIEWVYDLSRDRFGVYADPSNEETPQNRFGSIGNFTDQYRVIFGAVYNKNGDYISVITDDAFSSDAEKEVFPASVFKIYKVEAGRATPQISEIEASEITGYKSTMNTDTSVLMYTRYAEPKSIVVYENN